MKWIDPKVQRPENNDDVVVRRRGSSWPQTGWYSPESGKWFILHQDDGGYLIPGHPAHVVDDVVGWYPIPQ